MSTVPSKKPVIGITSDTYIKGPHLFHSAGDKYARSVIDGMGAIPLIIPAIPGGYSDLFNVIDGLLITGGYSNIQRQNYGLDPAPEGELEDPIRDTQDLELIPTAVDAGVPVLAICRGTQALNVAFGGTLHPRIHELDGRMDHRENTYDPIEIQYGPAHDITCTNGGLLHTITGDATFKVNSLHGQAVDTLGDGIFIEATAPDGTIEAISMPNAKNFVLGLQWHPEYNLLNNQQSKQIYDAFNRSILENKHK